MKIKTHAALLLTGIITFAANNAFGKYSGGTGVPEDPYLISSAADMNAIGSHTEDWDKHFVLTQDIDLSYYDGQSGRPAFSVIGYANIYSKTPNTWPFSGVFDGNDHKISNFTILKYYMNGAAIFRYMNGADAEIRDLVLIDTNINYSGNGNCGALVGRLESGTVRNCQVVGGIISGDDYLGGIVGDNWGLIENCFATCDVAGTTAHVGGLVGRNEGTILSCYATGNVSGTTLVGGLVGRHSAAFFGVGIISDCHASGSVTGNYAGGLVGQSWTGVITKSYASGYVSGGSVNGGLVGEVVMGGQTNSSFWNYETTGQLVSDGGTAKSTKEMMTKSTFTDAGWDLAEIWDMEENQTYPYLRTEPAGDLSHDKKVDFTDFAVLASHWLEGI